GCSAGIPIHGRRSGRLGRGAGGAGALHQSAPAVAGRNGRGIFGRGAGGAPAGGAGQQRIACGTGRICQEQTQERAMDRLTSRQLYDAVGERMQLRWVAGLRGEGRAIEPGAKDSRRPSQIGYLNIIYPNKVQIIGTEELSYLDSLDSRQRWETIEKIMAYRSIALIVTKDQAVPGDLRQAAEESQTPLWTSPKRGHE